MESEKVKEIKEALELNEYYAIEYFSKSGEAKIFTFTDILTLINELEKENQSLKESIEYGNEVCKECQSDKDKGVKWKLKRFAQMLKEKVVDKSENYVNQVVMATEIDETLKEMIGDDK